LFSLFLFFSFGKFINLISLKKFIEKQFQMKKFPPFPPNTAGMFIFFFFFLLFSSAGSLFYLPPPVGYLGIALHAVH